MYNEGGGGAVAGGGALSAGSLAATGFSVMGFAVVAFFLIITGVVLFRLAVVDRARRSAPGGDGFDPQAALAAALVATSGQDG